MSSDKKPITWGDIVELKYGKSLKNYKDCKEGYPVYGTNGPIGFTSKPLCPYPSVIIGRKGAYRGVHYSSEPFFVIDTAFFIVPKVEINLKWAYYRLLLVDINGMDSGSAIPSLSREDFYQIPIDLPTIEAQNKVVEILDSLENKITNNNRINKSLEEIAQALFKSWFVDFEPVKAKRQAKFEGKDPQIAAMCAICGKTVEEMQGFASPKYNELRATADLFPDNMVESELGLIPEGWELKSFGDLLEKTIGGDWGKEEPDEKHTEQVMIIRGTDIPTLQKGGIEKVPTRFVESKKLKTRKLQEGDIVIEVSGGSPTQPTGRSIMLTNIIINRLNNVAEPASFCRLFRPKNLILSYFLGQHLLYIYAEGKTWYYQNQSTGISNFQTAIFLEKELIPIPNKAGLLDTFKKKIFPLIDRSSSNENIKLVDVRDSLLPKLISGELEI